MKDLSVDEVAAEMGVDQETVRRLIRRGELSAYKVGGLWRVTRAALEDYKRRKASRDAAGSSAGL